MKMNQQGTTRGTKGESGEREPAGATASDASGERHGKITGGVGQGQHDALTGREGSAGQKESGEFNTGRAGGVVYNHQKAGYTPAKY